MPLEKDEAFVRSILGNDIELVTLTVEGRDWQGWERRIAYAGTTPSYLKDTQTLENLIKQSWLSFHERDIRLWSDFGRTYAAAIPNMPVLEILKYEAVGAHNCHGPEELATRKVQTVVAGIFDQCPFEILFADSAGLEAIFLEPVTQQQAEDSEALILSLEGCGDSINLMYTELYPPEAELSEDDQDEYDRGGDSVVVDYILQKYKLRLWWD